MCGIAGIVDLRKRAASRDVIERMTASVAHRGPDDRGIFVDENIALGHRRLSILDLSAAGHQPMASGDGTAHIVFNGEMYNYIELREELGGTYKSGSDTEVLLRAYERWGAACVEKCNGIFSFILWNTREKTLFCARDRLGVKPLYYAVHGDVLFLASEIKALLAAGVPAKPNDKIVHDFLVHGVYEHSEETFFLDIQQLMPGHTLTVKDGKLTVQRYWHLPSAVTDVSRLPDAEVEERYRELVTRAVTIQMRSDVPIGINASGGLDCSILTETVHRVSGGQKNFQLWSWNYGEERCDETPHVQALADHLGWTVNHVTLRPETVLQILPRVMRHEEQPFPGISIVARHLLYSRSDKETIVFLEGHGGDEIGGGYEYYFSSAVLDTLRTFGAKRAEEELRAYAQQHGFGNDAQTMQFFLNGLQSCLQGGMSADASSFVKRPCLNADFVSSHGSPPAFEQPFGSFLTNMQYRDVCWTKLPRVLRSVDRNSMAYGKEVRVPFLDHTVVEFAFSLPFHQKIRGGEQRSFMRRAFRDRLAASTINAPKRAVPDPQREWLQGPLRPWAEEIFRSQSFAARPYFDQKHVLAEYARYCAEENPRNSFHIWQWLNMELWLRTFID